jgi:hypothetical protein
MSVVRAKGGASKMIGEMNSGKHVSRVFNGPWFKYPVTQSVQPGDGPPRLDSVDSQDPPGRMAPQEAVEDAT